MRKLLTGFMLLIVLLAGCSSGTDFEVTLKEVPKYKAGESYPVVIKEMVFMNPASNCRWLENGSPISKVNQMVLLLSM